LWCFFIKICRKILRGKPLFDIVYSCAFSLTEKLSNILQDYIAKKKKSFSFVENWFELSSIPQKRIEIAVLIRDLATAHHRNSIVNLPLISVTEKRKHHAISSDSYSSSKLAEKSLVEKNLSAELHKIDLRKKQSHAKKLLKLVMTPLKKKKFTLNSNQKINSLRI